jgi:RNA polymerase sigma factor (sigma-70 family)
VSAADAPLLRNAQAGSVHAFEALVRTHHGLVRGFLRRLSGDAALADDLAQETFLIAWQRIAAYRTTGSFRGWLCQIAYRNFLQARRAGKSAAARENAVMQDAELATDERPATEARLDLDRVLADLSPDQRAVLALCYGEGMSHGETAEALSMPLGTVKSHVLRGREKVLARFAERQRS